MSAPRTLLAFLLGVFAGCGGPSSGTATDAGQDGLAACQIDWLGANGDDRELRSFDDRGRFVHAEWALNGGAVFMHDDFSYDDDRLVEGRYTKPTGELLEGDRWYWDDQHRVVRFTFDGNYVSGPYADGRLDFDGRYAYDASGRLARIDFRDADGQPLPNQYEILTWGDNGCMTGDDFVSPDKRDRATLLYRPGCVLTRIDHDYGADGTIDASETWDFDEHGRVTHYHGLSGDERTYYYGEDGRLSQIVFTTETERFTYCSGTRAEPDLRDSIGLPRALTRRLDRERGL